MNDKTKHLPKIIIEIADIIGGEDTFKLVRALGGGNLFVPKTKKSKNFSVFSEILGEKKALEFCKFFGGANLYIPKCQKIARITRDRDFREDVKKAIQKGETKQEAILKFSKKYGFNERCGWKIMSEK